MGMLKQTDVTKKTKLILRSTAFLQELRTWFGFIASTKSSLKMSTQFTMLLEGKHIAYWDKSNSLSAPLQWGAVHEGGGSLYSLLSLGITLDQQFVDNVRTDLPW